MGHDENLSASHVNLCRQISIVHVMNAKEQNLTCKYPTHLIIQRLADIFLLHITKQ